MKMTQYLKWKADSSKGEVFTPIGLVCKILNKIPEEVWRNPNATFLDPCMGKGTFLLEIVRRLVYIYGYTEDDAKSRVYGYDIRVKYINHLTRRGLKNVRHKDFLNEIIKMKFDVILGNPPYQINSKESNKRAEKLWTKFIGKSNGLLKDGGILSFVTPTSWLSGSKNISKGSYGVMDLFLENNLTYIEKGFKFENVSIDTHYWIMKKNSNYTNTIVFDSNTNEIKDINLRNGFFPSDLNNEKTSIIEKIFN
jgi:16S rRNA G966 N2-methylase RsmD